MEKSKIGSSIKQKQSIKYFNISLVAKVQKFLEKNYQNVLKFRFFKQIQLSIKQQVQKRQISKIKDFYKKNIQFKISLFEFENNIHDFIFKSDVVICRSGSSTIAELSVLNKPFIAIPLPSSLDNHQYFNAKYYYDKNCCWLLDENSEDFEDKMINILQDIYNSDVLLINKQNNLIKLNKKNAIDNFIKHILNKDGLTDK